MTEEPLVGGRASNAQGDHAALDRLIRELEACLLNEGVIAIRDRWRTLEKRIRRHLAFEEFELLEAYDAHDTEAAQAIEAAHDDLRTRLRTCRDGLESGRIDTMALRDVLQRYRMHQVREDTTLYRWLAAR